jgi:hypothetical protein
MVKKVGVLVGLGWLMGCDPIVGTYTGDAMLTASYPEAERPYLLSRGAEVLLAETDDDFVEVDLSQFACRIVGRRQSGSMVSLDAREGQTNACDFTGPLEVQQGAHRFVVETGVIHRAGSEMVMTLGGRVFVRSRPNASIGTFSYQFSGQKR